MRLGKTGDHFLHPYGVISEGWSGRTGPVQKTAGIVFPAALRFVIDRLRMQLFEYSVSGGGWAGGSQGRELPPREKAGWKRSRRVHLPWYLFLVSYTNTLLKVNPRGVQACSQGDWTFPFSSSFCHLSLTFGLKERLQCVKAQMVDSGVLAVPVHKLIPLQT